MKIYKLGTAAVLWALVATLAADKLLAGTIPTTNLFVHLNGDSPSNFVASGSNGIQLWKDLVHDGSDASQQDFGQVNTNKQPILVTNAAVPNSVHTGVTYNLVDFERSGNNVNGNSSNVNSDYLNAKTPDTARPANFGDPLTTGRDTAYEAGNLATGLSWFIVFQNTDDSVINNNNNAQTSSTRRWGQQSMIDTRYQDIVSGDGSGRFVWGEYAIDTATPAGDADTLGNLNNHIRTSTGGEVNHVGSPPVNLGLSQWFMAANTYDMVLGVFRTVVTTPDGAGGVLVLVDQTTDATTVPGLVNALGISNGTQLVNIALGAAGEAPTASQLRDLSFDGMMAEVMIYNAAMNGDNFSEFNNAVAYLHDKYFYAPEPTSGLLAGIALLFFGSMRTSRWRKAG